MILAPYSRQVTRTYSLGTGPLMSNQKAKRRSLPKLRKTKRMKLLFSTVPKKNTDFFKNLMNYHISKCFINFLLSRFFLSRNFRLNPFVLGVLLQPLNESISIPSSIILNRVSAFVFAPELESGETLDIYSCNLVFGRVNFCQHDVRVVGQPLSGFIIVRSQLFTMTAPRCIEFNENFLF